jgi:uncharacterized damage-inducible protein DinB
MSTIEQRFTRALVQLLREQYLPKIREAVERLPEADLWRRDHDSDNSVGNLLRHLAGNVRQYVIAGAGGKVDIRNRPAEFAARDGATRRELLDELERTVNEACAVLQALDDKALLERRRIQDREVVLFDALLHMGEHFAYHAGQIILIIKARTGQGFSWYAHLDPKP